MENLTNQLAGIISRSWWVLLLRGLVAIAFGALTYAQPGITVVTLAWLFGAYALTDGILAVWTAFGGRKSKDNWWVLFLRGLIGIGVGLITFIAPGVTAFGLLFYITIWAISSGLIEIVTAIRLRKEIEGEWSLLLSGLFSVAFGVLLMTRPDLGVLGVLWMVSFFAIIFGIILVILAFRARKFGHTLKSS